MRLYPVPPPRAVSVPDPATWEIRHADDPSSAWHDVPTVEYVERPVVATLLGPDGETLRCYSDRPPFGYQGAS